MSFVASLIKFITAIRLRSEYSVFRFGMGSGSCSKILYKVLFLLIAPRSENDAVDLFNLRWTG